VTQAILHVLASAQPAVAVPRNFSHLFQELPNPLKWAFLASGTAQATIYLMFRNRGKDGQEITDRAFPHDQ
jgi:hypothetical protein